VKGRHLSYPDGRGRRIAASSEHDKRLRAELAQGLGYFPASLAPKDIARYREQIAERKAREEAGERDGWGPGGYRCASGITSRKNGAAPRSSVRDVHWCTTSTSEPWCQRTTAFCLDSRKPHTVHRRRTIGAGVPRVPTDSRVIAATLGLLPA
jgi:hypothetical protein